MKLYYKSTKRIAKKIIRSDWKLLSLGLTMKVGDLIGTCKGWNFYITKIVPVYYKHNKGRFIVDFDVYTSDNCRCSFLNCCTYPAPDAKYMVERFKNLMENYPDPKCFGKQVEGIYNAISNNINPFNDLGLLKEEYVK
jgi:hypothetical protein